MRNAFTHSPELLRNPIAAGGQLSAWVLVHPTAWRNFLKRVEPALAPTFCMAELQLLHWRNPALRHALFSGGLAMPAAVGVIVSAVLLLVGGAPPLVLAGLVLGLAAGLFFSAAVSFGVGVAVSPVAVVACCLAFGLPGTLLIDFVFGLRFALIFGVVIAIGLYVAGNLSTRRFKLGAPRQIGSVVIGLVAGLGVIALIISVTTSLISQRQATAVSDSSTSLGFTVVPTLLLVLAVRFRARQWTSTAFISAVTFALITLLYGDSGREYSKEPEAPQLLMSFGAPALALFLCLFALPFALVDRVAGAWAGVIAGGLGSLGFYAAFGAIFGLYSVWLNTVVAAACVGLGLSMRRWLPVVLYPAESALGTLLLREDEARAVDSPVPRRPFLLQNHPAFWDETQLLRLGGLDEHVLLAKVAQPDQADAALTFLIDSPQRWAALAVQIELDARQLEACGTVADIAGLAEKLGASSGSGDDPAGALMRRFGDISHDARVALVQSSGYHRRLVLRSVVASLEGLADSLSRQNDSSGQRFRSIARQWQATVEAHLKRLDDDAVALNEIPDPYVVGTPLTRRQSVFVGRTDVSQRLEAILQNPDQPPLLLYGQRRMGKTSLLLNLRWMLPQRIMPIVVDLQGPVSLAEDHASFLYNVAKGITASAAQQEVRIDRLTREALSADVFTAFDDWLDGVEAALVARNRSTILLAFDEFESLDQAITAGALQEGAVLGTLRHIIQYRPRFKLIMAGSHTLGEFQRWSSYLINAQTIHLSYLRENEALQLIERPTEDFPLAYDPAASRRSLALTRGHPYLVQLLCSEVVALKNEQDPDWRHRARVDDVMSAVPETLKRGSQFFTDIQANQVSSDGLAVLHCMAQAGEAKRTPRSALLTAVANRADLEAAIQLLLRRELIEDSGDTYAFQVELIRRWFEG
jgi:hypothetical protein